MGVEEVYADVAADSTSTAGQILVSVEIIVLPAKMGVAELATTVGSVRGTPGEELRWVTTVLAWTDLSALPAPTGSRRRRLL